jgi:Tol biopolymer transport system component
MFKRHRIVFTALPLLLFCVLLVFLKTSSQSLPQAKLFAEGVINTDADEYGPAFTSDGKTLYFTRRVNRRDSEFIYVSRLESGKWSSPELAPFSGKYFDKEPFVSQDGQRIFFASLRPVDGVEPKNHRDFNIWFVEKTATGWSEPKHVGPPINSPAYENYPSVAANGTLYFAGEREGGKGGNDLYRARLVNEKYEHVERLDELNTPNVDADPYIAPDESYLIFCSNRAGGFGSGDLYISFNRNGKWTEPKNLGAAVNTAEFEYTPLISPDGKWLLFSRGWGEIYHIDRKAIDLAVPAKP